METLIGLPLVENLTKPIPDVVTTFYRTNVAKGTGEFGTFTMYDFLGSCTGITVTNCMQNVATTIQSMQLDTLLSIYIRMVNTINGIYNVTTPTPGVRIPPGPAGGFYTNRDSALSSGLIPAANNEIARLRTASATQCTSLNNNFTSICNRYVYEDSNQQQAGLVWADLSGNSKQSTISFIGNLDAAGVDRVSGGQSELISSLADTTKQSGQAILGSLREGRNNEAMDKAA